MSEAGRTVGDDDKGAFESDANLADRAFVEEAAD